MNLDPPHPPLSLKGRGNTLLQQGERESLYLSTPSMGGNRNRGNELFATYLSPPLRGGDRGEGEYQINIDAQD